MFQLGTVPLSCDLGKIEVDSDSVTLTQKNIAGLSESFTDAIRVVYYLKYSVGEIFTDGAFVISVHLLQFPFGQNGY